MFRNYKSLQELRMENCLHVKIGKLIVHMPPPPREFNVYFKGITFPNLNKFTISFLRVALKNDITLNL